MKSKTKKHPFFNFFLFFRYKFNIKKFPKAQIPDSINDLNTPMLSADHRVVKRMKNMPGITPHLTGRKLDTSGGIKKMDIFAKPELKEIKEDDGEHVSKEAKKAKKTKNALKNLRKFI